MIVRLDEEFCFGEAAAFEVPGAFEDAFEDQFLKVGEGNEVLAEDGFYFGEGFFEAEGDDESASGEVVADGVLGGFGFAFDGGRSG